MGSNCRRKQREKYDQIFYSTFVWQMHAKSIYYTCHLHSSCIFMANKPIQARIDEKLKKRVEKIFENLGLDTATAIRVFFKKVDLTGGIPFDIRDDGYYHYSPEQFRRIEEAYRESFEPKNLSRTYALPEETDELLRDLDLPKL